MATPFSRSLRSLEQDGHGKWLFGFAIVVALIGAWGAWFFLARVAVYEVTTRGRLETAAAVHPVEVAAGGRVLEVHLKLGDRVTKGMLLVQLDASEQRLALEEARARVEALSGQVGPLEAELAAAEQGLGDSQLAARGAVGEASARRRAASAEAERAMSEATRLEKLQAAGGATAADQERAALLARAQQSVAEAAGHAVARLEGEHRTQAADLRIRVEELRRQIADVAGQIRTGRATMERLAHEIESQSILAPVDGRVGEMTELRQGTMVSQGERIATIVPEGGVRAIGEFRASEALGRIRSGQPAHIRLHGFSWMRYGTVSARVARVATEAQDGFVRVELDVDETQSSDVPMEHGLPGDIEIEVEHVSPFELVLRAGGKIVSGEENRHDVAASTPALSTR